MIMIVVVIVIIITIIPAPLRLLCMVAIHTSYYVIGFEFFSLFRLYWYKSLLFFFNLLSAFY